MVFARQRQIHERQVNRIWDHLQAHSSYWRLKVGNYITHQNPCRPSQCLVQVDGNVEHPSWCVLRPRPLVELACNLLLILFQLYARRCYSQCRVGYQYFQSVEWQKGDLYNLFKDQQKLGDLTACFLVISFDFAVLRAFFGCPENFHLVPFPYLHQFMFIFLVRS